MSELSAEQVIEMRKAASQWFMLGHPEKARKLRNCIANNELAPPDLLAPGGRLKPEKVLAAKWSDEDIPPRHGKGSGKVPWQDFLIKFTEMDEGVVRKLGREDCIQIAQERGIIPPDRASVN